MSAGTCSDRPARAARHPDPRGAFHAHRAPGSHRRAALIGLLAGVALAGGCSPRIDGPDMPLALDIGTNRTVYAVTSRATGPDGSYGDGRSAGLGLLELTVSIPPNHRPGQMTHHRNRADPQRDFVIARSLAYDDPAAFRARIDRDLSGLPRDEREVSIFVHGYNATQSETAFRAAQIAEDIRSPAVNAIYSWPSRGQLLGYVYDHDSMLFARDGLETMLLAAGQSRAERIVLVGHSMGALLTMEALRQIEIARPGWATEHVGGVILIAPDVDIDVFRAQVARMKSLPQPFLIFVSDRDRALSLSAFLRGKPAGERLGSLSNASRMADLPVTIIDTSDHSGDAASSHLVPVTSPTMIALLRRAVETSRTMGEDDAYFAVIPPAGRAVYGRLPEALDTR
ncbi:alpha/beta hydrolase [Marinibacterium sp. SX1]|uniref:alpha/beta hydrolase n=1 Tax=Marinibacterium sp. SX1 TaxID=3388424 RepID=UPI003D181C69